MAISIRATIIAGQGNAAGNHRLLIVFDAPEQGEGSGGDRRAKSQQHKASGQARRAVS
jgi:hypothetical protein